MNKNKIFGIIIMVLFLGVLIAMIVQLLPLLTDILSNRNDETSIVSTVDALGWRGPLSLVGLAAIQVIIFLIPAPAIGVLTGLTYGVLWGLLIFLGGVALGNLFVVFFMRKFASLFRSNKKKKIKKNNESSLKDKVNRIKRPEIIAFFLFMIPFVSSAGPYLFAETNVKLWKYIVAVVLGTLPTAVLYVFLGNTVSQGNYTSSIVIAAIFVVAIIFILIFRKKLLNTILGGVK
ncbi:MAG: VTT domain-containing protein [Oscillospiraceae bacterium]|jgi:uncharacterized membrane protein YdjX (TVP38/TMEM64 family)|nr:VTT domain-containing protein [Oscillospiraceae bacterium]